MARIAGTADWRSRITPQEGIGTLQLGPQAYIDPRDQRYVHDAYQYFLQGQDAPAAVTAPTDTAQVPGATDTFDNGGGGGIIDAPIVQPIDRGGGAQNPLTQMITDPTTGQTKTVKQAFTDPAAYNIPGQMPKTPAPGMVWGPQQQFQDPMARPEGMPAMLGDRGQSMDHMTDPSFWENVKQRATAGADIAKEFGADIADKLNYLKNQGIDVANLAGSALMNAVMPGASYLAQILPKDTPIERFNRQYNVGEEFYEDIVQESDDPNLGKRLEGYYNTLQSGNLAQDPFGKNTVSGFGDYPKYATDTTNMLVEKAKERARQGKELTQFDKDRLEYYSHVSGLSGKTNVPGTPLMVDEPLNLENIIKKQEQEDWENWVNEFGGPESEVETAYKGRGEDPSLFEVETAYEGRGADPSRFDTRFSKPGEELVSKADLSQKIADDARRNEMANFYKSQTHDAKPIQSAFDIADEITAASTDPNIATAVLSANQIEKQKAIDTAEGSPFIDNPYKEPITPNLWTADPNIATALQMQKEIEQQNAIDTAIDTAGGTPWDNPYKEPVTYGQKSPKRAGADAFGAYLEGETHVPSGFTHPMAKRGKAKVEPGENLTEALKAAESGNNYTVKNDQGYMGAYQFGDKRLQDYKDATGEKFDNKTFINDPELQDQVFEWHVDDIIDYIDKNNLDEAIGTEINGVPVTQAGLIAVAHLGGNSGMQQFINTDGNYNPSDNPEEPEKGTTLLEYLEKFSETDAKKTYVKPKLVERIHTRPGGKKKTKTVDPITGTVGPPSEINPYEEPFGTDVDIEQGFVEDPFVETGATPIVPSEEESLIADKVMAQELEREEAAKKAEEAEVKRLRDEAEAATKRAREEAAWKAMREKESVDRSDTPGRHQAPGGSGYGPWSRAKGGLIRKPYGNGGIVDLL